MKRISADSRISHYLCFYSDLEIYLGGSLVNSTIPADLLELKARFETWRSNRKYLREPILNDLWNAAFPSPLIN
jgi:hypothetical protein